MKCIVMYGLGGATYSGGMNILADKLRAIPTDTPAPVDFQSWQILVPTIKFSTSKIVLIGHSMGANAASWIADAVYPRRISLIVSFDAGGIFTGKKLIRDNVDRVINIVSNNWTNWLGHGSLKGESGYPGTIIRISTSDTHVAVDDDSVLQAIAVNAVRGLKA